ncbi:MAG TPA: DUF3300 domain-containing protein [Bryobacteraceae bacterium]|nr:DUF3300 domain-containing protein [Bryobacteraceae bacterium]
MKRCSVRPLFRKGLALVCALVVAGTGAVALAQEPVPPPQNQAQAPALPPQQLDNLVAPIALYPDPLLGQVLAASTYPVELVEAQQWLQANGNLHGQQLMDAARQQNWDASIQALVAMPDVLGKLTQDIRWTTDLGNAFLAQQADVMAAVQRMRARAQANGRLQSNAQETVTTDNQGGQSAVVIQPADPQVMYVPTYDPYYVWGPPAWGYYPSLFYPGYGYWFGPGINVGLYFGGWGGWGFGGWGWGWGPNWFGRSIFVNTAFFNRYGFRGGFGGGFGGGLGGLNGRAAWAHDPGHRLGVGYPNSQLSSRFGAASQASRMAAGRSGNWHSFSQGNNNVGNRNSFQRSAPQAGARSSQALQGSSNWQHFQGRQSYQGSAQRYQAPSQQRYQGQSQQRYQGQSQRYSAPAQRYSAPAQRFQSAPRMSAPSSGGGSSRSFSGGGGGGGYHGGGGGGGSHGGGGGHGRR